LVKELRLAGIRDFAGAYQFLPGFTECLNEKFGG
jgi:hypothetical protein